MRALKSVLLTGASTVILAGTAFAADMGMPAKAPMAPPPPPVASWEGFYLGLNGGVGRLNTGITTASEVGVCGDGDGASCNIAATGGVFGGQIGYNWQSRYWVYGLEADGDWTGLSNSQTVVGCCGGTPFAVQRGKVDWLASGRVRAGLALDDTLVYFTGGIAWGGTKSGWGNGYTVPRATCCDVTSGTRFGWVAGFGVEHMLWDHHWTVRGEALYYDLGKQDVTNTFEGFNYTTQFSHEVFVARAGINYKW